MCEKRRGEVVTPYLAPCEIRCICLSDDRRARSIRQVDAHHVERRSEVFNDQAMQRVRSVSIRASGRDSGREVRVHLLGA